MYQLITIGDCVIDTHVQIDEATLNCGVKQQTCQLCFEYADKIPIKDSFQSLGGNAANVAVGTTKLGLNSAIISSIGDDANGQMIIDELKKFNVNPEYINLEKKAKTRYSIVINFKGERTILSFHGKREYTWPKNMPATDWIYYTGLSKGFEKIHEQYTSWIKKHPSIKTAFNPGSYQLKYSMEKVKEMAALADILIINKEEAIMMSDAKETEEKTISALVHKLLSLGAKEIVITDAQNGAYVGNMDEIWHIDTFPVQVVAKTGAGDAFSSGYISARCYGYNRPQSLRWGIANSCGVITKVGAQNGLLDRKQIEKMLKKYPSIIPKIMS